MTAVGAVLVAQKPVTLAAEFAAVVLALCFTGRRRNVFRAMAPAWPVVILVFAVGLIFYDLMVASLLSVRLFVLLSVSFIFFVSMDPRDIGDALTKSGAPYEMSFILTASMRYVPMIGRKVRQISDAQQSRGIDLKPGIRNIPNLLALLIPLFVQCFMLADDLALAMESRGFGRKKRSMRRNLRFKKKDYAAMAASVALFVTLIWLERR